MGLPASLAGQTVVVETVLWENPHLAYERLMGTFSHPVERIVVPAGQRTGGVPSADYDAYRAGLDSACADVVVCSRLRSGKAVVLASKRGPGKPFAGCWWMQGGATHSYRSILEFVSERAEKECGIRPTI